MTDAVGFASVGVEPMSVGKRVFLLAIVAIPTVMRRMTTAFPTVQKAACGRKKSPAHAGKKNTCLWWVQPQPGLGLFRALGWAERCALYIKQGGVGQLGVTLWLSSSTRLCCKGMR